MMNQEKHKRKTNIITVTIFQRILVLVHSDIDSICASKVLQSLFRADHILYTIVPVKVSNCAVVG